MAQYVPPAGGTRNSRSARAKFMAGAMSEIILCEDSEITAVPAVEKKNGSPEGAAELYHCCRRQQFR